MSRNWSVPASIVTLLVLLASVSGWGACTSGNFNFSVVAGFGGCKYWNGTGVYCYNGDCSSRPALVANSQPCAECDSCKVGVIKGGNYYYTDCKCTNPQTGVCETKASNGSLSRYCYTRCGTQIDADSVNCVNNGHQWDSISKICRTSACTPSDTSWLNDSRAACDAIGGENNYAIADIDETCVHSGICCSPDSALVGNTCKWRCDSIYTACTAKNGYLYAVVLQDTTISGEDSIFTNKCYYNCSYAYNKDSTTSVTDGNTACSSPSTPIADCTRMPNDFSSVRTTYGDSVYSYDFLTPGSAAYIDSIVLTPCSRFMYRCTVNGKYKYWYSDADIPTGCTNIVKIK